MARGYLTVSRVEKQSKPGRYADGGCLYLVVTKTGSKQWVARVTIHGRQTDLGLGGASYVTLDAARMESMRLRRIARAGDDPRADRKKEMVTFDDAAKRVHAALLPTWKNTRHADTWLSSVQSLTSKAFGTRPIEKVRTADVLKVLEPIWTEKFETANRLKQRLAAIFDWAKGAGHYPHENPMTGLQKALPMVKRSKEHLDAMAWADLPAFMADVAQRDGVSARCLEFIILTAARSGEARGARWSEVDGDVWTVPAERMKRGLPHRVPLSPQALAILEKVRGLDDDLIFAGKPPKEGDVCRPLSDMVFKALFLRMKREGFTTHGFRSTFRDWCGENGIADREVAEAALSHATGNEVERAYARSDLFERRRKLMSDWSVYCRGK